MPFSRHCTNWALYLRGGIILLSISPSLRNVPKTYTGHISPYDILLYILPLCSATSMGNLYAWSSFTKWKNVTTELRMLCEETNRKCNIYNSLSVYFVFFSFFNFFQVKMQQLAFFLCVCAIAMVSFGCTPDACLMVLPILQHMSLTSCENTDFVKLSPGCAVGEDNPFKVSSVNMALKSDLKLVSRYLLFSDIKKSCSWSYY